MQEAAAAATDKHEIFQLYPTCRLVKGGARSAIYDLDRRLLFRFHSAYLPLFEWAEAGISSKDLAQLEPLALARSLEAIAFLQEREVGRYLDPVSFACLVPLQDRWDSANSILSAIVDIDLAEPDWETLIPQLDILQTRFLQLRCFSSLLNREGARRILRLIDGSRITRIELFLKWSPEWDDQDWRNLFEEFRNLQHVRLHSALEDRELSGLVVSDLPRRQVRFETKSVDGATHCGAIVEGSLSIPSTWLFGELRNFNGCLNRKVSIRADGQICNCPSMRTVYGSNLQQLTKIVSSSDFQRVWTISKDKINICNGCEFRYVCTDCRAYLGDDLSIDKPARCKYDPATGYWAV